MSTDRRFQGGADKAQDEARHWCVVALQARVVPTSIPIFGLIRPGSGRAAIRRQGGEVVPGAAIDSARRYLSDGSALGDSLRCRVVLTLNDRKAALADPVFEIGVLLGILRRRREILAALIPCVIS